MSTQEKGTALSQKVATAAESISNIPGIEDPIALIENRLAQLGIYGEEDHEILTSPDCTEGDARSIFCEGEPPALPIPRFKRMWRILKGAAEKSEVKSLEELLGSGMGAGGHMLDPVDIKRQFRPYGQWKDSELLEAYGPDCDDEIFGVLNKRSNGRAFIVFCDEEKNHVDIEASLAILRLARRQATPDMYPVNGVPKKLYPVGVFPSVYQTECPLHPDTLLFGGYCEHCKNQWSNADLEQMQFARIAQQKGEVPGYTPKEIRLFIEELIGTPIENLRESYPETYLEFSGDVMDRPRLMKKMSSHSVVKDPVFGNKKRY